MGKREETNRSKKGHLQISRRRLITQAGVVGTAGLFAGCNTGSQNGTPGGNESNPDGSENGSGGNDSVGSETKEPLDSKWDVGHWYSANPSKMQYNTSSTAPTAPAAFDNLTWYTAHEEAETGWMNVGLAKDWNFDSDSNIFKIELKDSTWWHNNNQLSSKDLKVTFELTELIQKSWREMVDSYEINNEKTLSLNLSQTFNPSFLKERILLSPLDRPTSIYKRFAEDFSDATTEDEIKSVQEELLNFTVEKPIGNSLFKHHLSESSPGKVVAEVHDGHYNADAWKGVKTANIYGRSGGSGANHQKFLSNKIDAMTTVLPRETDRPKNTVEVYNPEFVVASYRIDHEGPLSDWRVRKGLQYLFDRKQLSGNMRPKEFPPIENIVGLSHSHEKFLGEEFLSNTIEHYGPDNAKFGSVPEKTESLFKQAGLTKEGGSWITKDGDVWEPLIISHGFGPWTTAGLSAQNVLEEFGVQANFSTVEIASIWSRIEQGNYDLHVHFSATGISPYFAYRDLTGETTAIRNFPGDPDHGGTLKVPPMGEPEGELQSVSPPDLLSQLSQTTDGQNLQEQRRRLSWIWNQTLPAIQIGPRMNGQSFMSDHWNIVPENDPRHDLSSNVAVIYPQTGGIKPKYK